MVSVVAWQFQRQPSWAAPSSNLALDKINIMVPLMDPLVNKGLILTYFVNPPFFTLKAGM